jgi:DNA repair photolyase
MESQAPLDLFRPATPYPLPSDHEPRRPRHFSVERIFLAKGSATTEERKRFVELICCLYPEAEIIECPEVSHNRIDLSEPDALKRHYKGKHTLVFGELGDSVRFSSEEGNTCPNYWHFSPYGFCPYGCKYCYLAGTTGVFFSPTVKVFVNLEDILPKIDATANRLGKPTAFYLGKLQDGLALDPLTGYSRVLVPFFARHPFARQVLLTKSDDVEGLVDLDHNGRTILSWSLNPPQVAGAAEENVPNVYNRLRAMRLCAAAGYPLRAVIMPVIPVNGWRNLYHGFIEKLLSTLPIERLTIGGICSYRKARSLMDDKLGTANPVSHSMERDHKAGDGRMRYSPSVRVNMYRFLIDAARTVTPDVELALCLEERDVWEAVGLTPSIGRCNCVL